MCLWICWPRHLSLQLLVMIWVPLEALYLANKYEIIQKEVERGYFALQRSPFLRGQVADQAIKEQEMSLGGIREEERKPSEGKVSSKDVVFLLLVCCKLLLLDPFVVLCSAVSWYLR